MKKIIALVAATSAFAFSNAQVVTNNTANIGETYQFSWSSSGNAYSLTDLPIYQAHFNLPFGLSFDAGHSVVYGQAMKGTEFVGNVFGYSLFAQKDIGGDGAFIRCSASALIGDRKPDFAFSAGLGFRF